MNPKYFKVLASFCFFSEEKNEGGGRGNNDDDVVLGEKLVKELNEEFSVIHPAELDRLLLPLLHSLLSSLAESS